jgi:hypothetical protein
MAVTKLEIRLAALIVGHSHLQFHQQLPSSKEFYMPLKVSVGLSKKIGQPDYGSLGASCHVEFEADAGLLHSDLETFHRQVKGAFIACKQAVQDELSRHQQGDASEHSAQNGNGHHAGNGRTNGQSRSKGRPATTSQVRALESIGKRLQIDLGAWLLQKYGLRIPSQLSICDASAAIDELKSQTNGSH